MTNWIYAGCGFVLGALAMYGFIAFQWYRFEKEISR